MTASRAGWRRHRLFGLTLNSDFPFASRLAPGSGAPDLCFTCRPDPPEEIAWERHPPAYASPYRTPSGAPVALIHRLPDLDILRFPGVADFYLYPDAIRCHPLAPDMGTEVEIRLLGTVMSFWLERRQIPMLHAAAIGLEGRAVVFLASNKGGKSSLAAAFMQAGCPLLTDDILPIEAVGGQFLGRPGYPSMRFWPVEAQHFLGHYETLPQVHPELSKRRVPVGAEGFGRFHDGALPLAGIYLPERQDEWADPVVDIQPVGPAEALMELVRHSFIARIVQALGWQPQRLATFARLIQQVPVRRLIYPSGFEHLSEVREAIRNDVSRGVGTAHH